MPTAQWSSPQLSEIAGLFEIPRDAKKDNEVILKDSAYSGEKTISVASTTSFTYTLDQFPENVSYASTLGSVLSYETNSLYPSGPIAKFTITNRGRNYFELPGITTVITQSGQNADVKLINTNTCCVLVTFISYINPRLYMSIDISGS